MSALARYITLWLHEPPPVDRAASPNMIDAYT